MRNLVLAGLMFMSAAAAAAAPASQPSTRADDAPKQEPPKVHRMRAGTPDRRGWCVARSTGAGFTVSMPRQFNDITVTRREADGAIVTTHMVAAVDAASGGMPTAGAGARFTASSSSNSAAQLPRDAAEVYLKMLAERGEVRGKRSVKMDGVDGTEIEVMTEWTCTRYRVVQLENVIFSLTVEVPGQEFSRSADAAAKRFFESFRFPTPDAEDAPGAHAQAQAAAP